MKTNVTALISKTERIESADGAVSANVRTDGTTVAAFEGGAVKRGEQQVATFGCYGGSSLNIQYMTDDDRAGILAMVEEFIAAVKGGEA